MFVDEIKKQGLTGRKRCIDVAHSIGNIAIRCTKELLEAMKNYNSGDARLYKIKMRYWIKKSHNCKAKEIVTITLWRI